MNRKRLCLLAVGAFLFLVFVCLASFAFQRTDGLRRPQFSEHAVQGSDGMMRFVVKNRSDEEVTLLFACVECKDKEASWAWPKTVPVNFPSAIPAHGEVEIDFDPSSISGVWRMKLIWTRAPGMSRMLRRKLNWPPREDAQYYPNYSASWSTEQNGLVFQKITEPANR